MKATLKGIKSTEEEFSTIARRSPPMKESGSTVNSMEKVYYTMNAPKNWSKVSIAETSMRWRSTGFGISVYLLIYRIVQLRQQVRKGGAVANKRINFRGNLLA